MDEFAVDPQRGAGVGEMDALEEANPTAERATRSSRRASAALAWPQVALDGQLSHN
jgi:hypothetical protein